MCHFNQVDEHLWDALFGSSETMEHPPTGNETGHITCHLKKERIENHWILSVLLIAGVYVACYFTSISSSISSVPFYLLFNLHKIQVLSAFVCWLLSIALSKFIVKWTFLRSRGEEGKKPLKPSCSRRLHMPRFCVSVTGECMVGPSTMLCYSGCQWKRAKVFHQVPAALFAHIESKCHQSNPN